MIHYCFYQCLRSIVAHNPLLNHQENCVQQHYQAVVNHLKIINLCISILAKQSRMIIMIHELYLNQIVSVSVVWPGPLSDLF